MPALLKTQVIQGSSLRHSSSRLITILKYFLQVCKCWPVSLVQIWHHRTKKKDEVFPFPLLLYLLFCLYYTETELEMSQ